ncbi:mannosyl-glycoprotein endo-beta-N-acetylglucosamidase [Paenibacillus sp. HJL G12]|uniref:Mannosyl-glycoprotein endo-beta-N-acetylglucosamidase n=1 Tax=Paenibacillus dendrobii TaxID=2691084 RepID=A0A7X3IKS0_9BACL|nr:glycoside hydrolase family 73 protein [Paenibacillus dendrobii]MWV45779.1 mannosyl-glycoprotein endo-beta-N-acetylglucosamidase [Paenibacillus dendrobii]
MNRADFIAKIAPLATADQLQTGVPASLTIAQAALESSWGGSGLTAKANNLFGIKGEGPAGSIRMLTSEYIKGTLVQIEAYFRMYHSWGESIQDHSRLIVNGVAGDRRYAGALNADGKTAARLVAKAGYATDPQYADKLIQIMDQNNLYQYDAKSEEGEPMTKEEKAAFEALQAAVAKQSEWMKQQDSLQSMPCPVWAKDAYEFYKPFISDDKGSYDYWRQLVIQYRHENGIRVNNAGGSK